MFTWLKQSLASTTCLNHRRPYVLEIEIASVEDSLAMTGGDDQLRDWGIGELKNPKTILYSLNRVHRQKWSAELVLQ